MAWAKGWFLVMAGLKEWRGFMKKEVLTQKAWKLRECKKFLERMSDFKYKKTKVERLVASRGHQAIFRPKFHYELNLIEYYWCHSKRYTRSHCDYTFPGLLAIIDQSLNSVTLDMIRKFFRKTQETMRAYCEGLTPGPEMTNALKTYESRRRISEPQ